MKRSPIRDRISWVRRSLPSFCRTHGHRPLRLVTYDANTVSRWRAAEVAHFIFGRLVRRRNDGGAMIEYEYRGFIHRPGVLWVGQSVLLVTPERLAELEAYLRRHGVMHHGFPISVR